MGAKFVLKKATNGKPYFLLTATKGQIIGQSEMYESVASMETDIASVKKNAPVAKTEDLTVWSRMGARA